MHFDSNMLTLKNYERHMTDEKIMQLHYLFNPNYTIAKRLEKVIFDKINISNTLLPIGGSRMVVFDLQRSMREWTRELLYSVNRIPPMLSKTYLWDSISESWIHAPQLSPNTEPSIDEHMLKNSNELGYGYLSVNDDRVADPWYDEHSNKWYYVDEFMQLDENSTPFPMFKRDEDLIYNDKFIKSDQIGYNLLRLVQYWTSDII